MKQYRLPVIMHQPSDKTENKYMAEVPILTGRPRVAMKSGWTHRREQEPRFLTGEADRGTQLSIIAEPLFCLLAFSSSIILAWRFQY